MATYFNKNDELVIYSLLKQLMEADDDIHPKEVDFLNEITGRFGLSQTDIDQAKGLSVEECKNKIGHFTAHQLQELKSLLVKMAYADGIFIKQEQVFLESLLGISHFELELIADWQDEAQIIVGLYTKKKDGSYCFEDIRSLGFSALTYKNGNEIVIPTDRIPELEENTYYQFPWTVELDEGKMGFHLVPKRYNFTRVEPKELVDRLYNTMEKSGPEVNDQLKRVLAMVNTQLTASSDGTFIYELLQNANDYPVEGKYVDVEFHLTGNYLIYRHTGCKFSPRNIAAISKVASGEKEKKKNAIGYKGIGFKTVFNENQYVFLKSGEYTLRFDESILNISRRYPWQIMPIWTPETEVDEEVRQIMSNASEFRVQMAIRPKEKTKLRDDDKSYEYIFNDIFKDEKDILFVPNVQSVKVFYDGEEKIKRIKNREKWALTEEPFVYEFKKEEIEENNEEVRNQKSIPEKYKDFKDTHISFACRREGRILKPVENARIYCYLPTQVSFGFPFLMNTDMIPTGARDDIMKGLKFNHKLITIAGGKFVEWIAKLIKSGEYDLCSVFTILPSFKKVVNYEAFIDKFKEGFDKAVETVELIPTNSIEYKLVKNIVLDSTGLSSSGIMTDEEFLKFTGYNNLFLPVQQLREDKLFKSFLSKYAKDGQKFTKENITGLVANEDFQKWLKVQENNNKFLNFLLEKEYLSDFLEEKLFLSNKDGLYKASELFNDIDEYLVDLQAFTDHINHLSLATGQYFKDNSNWDEVVKDAFLKFDCNKWVVRILSEDNRAETIQRLKAKETSTHFFKFLAEKVVYKEDYRSLPFFNDTNQVIDDFNEKFIFFSSHKGHEVCGKKWLDGIKIEFLSQDYCDTVRTYLTKYFGVKDYYDSVIIDDILLSDDYHTIVAGNIKTDVVINKDFVDFLFSHSEAIKGIEIVNGDEKKIDFNRFNNYDLFFENGNGEQKCLPASSDCVFTQIKPDYLQFSWLDKSWLFKIACIYCSGKSKEDAKALEGFFKKYFGLADLNDARLRTICKNHIEELKTKLLSSKELNLSFWSFLVKFKWSEQSKDLDVFKSLPIVDEIGKFHSDFSNENNLYYFESELYQICQSSWMTDGLITILSSNYSTIEGLEGLFDLFGFKKYNPQKFAPFFEDVIVNQAIPTSIPNIITATSYNISLDTEVKCADFHNFMSTKYALLNDIDKALLKGTPVYVYGKNASRRLDIGYRSYILSPDKFGILKYCSRGLLPEINAINDTFITMVNQKYWTDVMGCIQMNESELCTWLEQNSSAIGLTIQNIDLNKSFWAWLFSLGGSVREKVGKLKVLPIIHFTSINDGQEEGITVSSLSVNEVYMSNPYTGQANIEDFARKHGKKNFISSSYLSVINNPDEWRRFFKRLGVKDDVKDVIYSIIMNDLPTLKDKSFPWLLADQYSKEIADPEKWKELAPKLINLQVETTDGSFVSITNAIRVTVDDYSQKEPFKMIKLVGEISREYYQNENVKNLINKIAEQAKTKKITEFQQWVDAKVNRYLQMQNSLQSENFESIHFEFIKEWLSHKDKYIITNGRDIKLYDRGKELKNSELLFLGSNYECKCDFERFNITKTYVSDDYLKYGKSRDVTYLLRALIGCRDRFDKCDIKYLTDKDFSIYFWCKYVGTKDITILSTINSLVKEGALNDTACIPSESGSMKKAKELYSSSLSDFMKYIPNYQEKIIDKKMHFSEPLIELCKQCLDTLTVNDCIDFLINSKPKNKNRAIVLEWLLDSTSDKKDSLLQSYLSHEKAWWLNGQGDPKLISELLAVDPNNCKQAYVFSTSSHVIDLAYFPKGRELEVCEMFGITVFSDDDLVPKPIKIPDGGQTLEVSNEIIRRLLLVIALRYKYEWQDWFDSLKQKLEDVGFWLCESISYGYGELSIDNEDFYFDQNSKTFFYVDSWQDKKVYESFVTALCEYLNMDLDYRECKSKLDENFSDGKVAYYLNQNCRDLFYDDEFVSQIQIYWADIICLLDIETNEENFNDEDVDIDHVEEMQSKYYEDELDEEQPSDEEHEETWQEKSGLQEPTIKPTQTNGSNVQGSTSSHDDRTQKAPLPQSLDSKSVNNETQLSSGIRPTDQRATQDSRGTAEPYKPDNRPSIDRRPGSHSSHQNGQSQRQRRTPYEPKAPTLEEINRFKYQTSTKTLSTEEMRGDEYDALNKILGEGLSAEEIIEENYLAQLRFWGSLKENGYIPADSVTIEDFIRNSKEDQDYELANGKYVHRCSARGGVLYVSPSIWNMVTDDRCIICVFVGSKVNEFFYIRNKTDLLNWISEDAIVIKLTGDTRAEAVNKLYSEILRDAKKGSAYTLIRVAYNEVYDSLFAQIQENDANQQVINEDDYGD